MAELSADAAARFARQIMLPGVGVRGQAALLAGAARVGGHEVAARYAERAGCRVVDGAIDVDELAPREVVRAPAARQALAGARAALREIRRLLGEVDR